MKKRHSLNTIPALFCFLSVFLAILSTLIPLHAKEDETSLSLPKMEQTSLMGKESDFFAKAIPQLHYLHTRIEDLDGKAIVESFMKALDYGKLYFVQKDKEIFMRFAPSMGTYIRMANNYPAFEIYSTYRTRILERIDWATKRLDGDFDFSTNKTFLIDRKDVDWPETDEAADALWEDYLTYQLLNEILSLKISDNDSEMGNDVSRFGTSVKQRKTDKKENAKQMTDDEILQEAKNVVKRRLQRMKKNVSEIEAEEVHEVFLTTIANQYDPHSTFMSSSTMETFSISMKNSLIGIGATLEDNDGICTIRELTPGAPAALSRKLSPGDKIIGVRQEKEKEFTDVIDMKLSKVVSKIRGKKGTKVYLQIRPVDGDPSERREVMLIRDEVKITQNLASARYFDLPQDDGSTIGIGVIELPSFYGSDSTAPCTQDVKELINKLKKLGIKGLILDLRTNGGGLLTEAVSLTGLFIPEGPVVQVNSSDGNLRILKDEDKKTSWDGPLMVLTSRMSASASEIVAGALQNYNRALVIGDPATHGKGTVQTIFDISNFYSLGLSNKQSAAVKITIQKFYLPNGDSTQLKGVVSDISFPSINPLLPIGESDLDHALPWDSIKPTDFKNIKLNKQTLVTPELIAKLKEKSDARQKDLEEFSFLKTNIDWFAERQNQKTFSLNLQERLKQRESDKKFKKDADDEMEKLAKEEYQSEEVLLDTVVEERNAEAEEKKEKEQAKAQTNNGASDEVKEDPAISGDTEDIDEKKPVLDIHLQESVRIMLDWLKSE